MPVKVPNLIGIQITDLRFVSFDYTVRYVHSFSYQRNKKIMESNRIENRKMESGF